MIATRHAYQNTVDYTEVDVHQPLGFTSTFQMVTAMESQASMRHFLTPVCTGKMREPAMVEVLRMKREQNTKKNSQTNLGGPVRSRDCYPWPIIVRYKSAAAFRRLQTADPSHREETRHRASSSLSHCCESAPCWGTAVPASPLSR